MAQSDALPQAGETPARRTCWCGELVAPHHPALCERHAYFEAAWADGAARWRRRRAA
jgi:hypothetical protein